MPSVRHVLRLLPVPLVLLVLALAAGSAGAAPRADVTPRLAARAVPGGIELTLALTAPRLGSDPSLELGWRVQGRRGTDVAAHAETIEAGLAAGTLVRRWTPGGLRPGRYVLVARVLLDRGPRSGPRTAAARLAFRLG